MPIATLPSSRLPEVFHATLDTTFCGIEHAVSTPEAPVHQYRGIKYAAVPARFRQPTLHEKYPPMTDASKYGPICPQLKRARTAEEDLFELSEADIPQRLPLKQNEFECLNLNITCPAGLSSKSRLPVMVWIHGGGDRGSGSNWIYDAGPLVQKSLTYGKPVIIVSLNFRIGLLGFAATPAIREDNEAAGEIGVGNYGLHDQRKALEWIHNFIADFGGDASNITLFGSGTGAADIISHRLSAANETKPLFHRAIIQSAVVDENLPNVSTAGWNFSRLISTLGVSTLAQLRAVEPDALVSLGFPSRATDDGKFFRSDWRQHLHVPEHEHELSVESLPSSLQPLIIGDCSADAFLWSLPASLWTSFGASRRVNAICQSIHKSTNLMCAYDISPHTPEDEITDRVLDLINDTRVAWPTERVARAAKRFGAGVWRYIFDQQGPTRGLPHHSADIGYLFDNVPLPASSSADIYYDGSYSDSDSDADENMEDVGGAYEQWDVSPVDSWSYARVRDAMQERWLSFANDQVPWNKDKVFVFGPEGETGERSDYIFKGRRRTELWKEVLHPLGTQLVQKIGLELSRGPSTRC